MGIIDFYLGEIISHKKSFLENTKGKKSQNGCIFCKK